MKAVPFENSRYLACIFFVKLSFPLKIYKQTQKKNLSIFSEFIENLTFVNKGLHKDYNQIHPKAEFLDVACLISDWWINTVIMDSI